MIIEVNTHQRDYEIHVERGVLSKAGELIGNRRKLFLVSDTGVPSVWKLALTSQFQESVMYEIPMGERNKTLEEYGRILEFMAENHMNRKDVLVALGGGVTGDMAGFAAATYMRGIQYVNIPTTTLAQIDSSIGGKTAVDLNGLKNIAGAFWQPSLVLIDPTVLSTLPARHVRNGLAEAVKMGLIGDDRLFELFEKDDYMEHLDEIIVRSLVLKKEIVERDETEQGERKLLNFGHTYGHAIESSFLLEEYLHGECVGMGMLMIMKNEQLKKRLEKVLMRIGLPVSCEYDKEKVFEKLMSDKKGNKDGITVVQVDEPGQAYLENWSYEQLREGL